MHYHPSILNKNKFFLSLSPILSAKFKKSPIKKIEEFLYRASCVLTSCETIYASERDTVFLCRNYLNQIKLPVDKRIGISSEIIFPAYSQIPNALGSLIDMQNLLIPIWGSMLGLKNLPSNFHKAINKGLEEYGFNKKINTLCNNYWNNGGKYLRDVRDVDQHFNMLIDHTYFQYINDPGSIEIVLPDNPELKSQIKYTFKKNIDACQTIIDGIKQLDKLMKDVLSEIGYKKEKIFKHSLFLDHMGELNNKEEKTLGIMINILSTKKTSKGTSAVVEAIELMQIIPKNGKGNIAIRKLKTDKEMGDKKHG